MVQSHKDNIQVATMVQIMHKNALVCAVQQVYVCRQVKEYDFSDRLPFCFSIFFLEFLMVLHNIHYYSDAFNVLLTK